MSHGMTRLGRLSPRTMKLGRAHLGTLKTLLVGSSLGLAAVLAIATGCSRDNVAHAAASESAMGQADLTSAIQEEAQPYAIETAVVGDCKAGAECTATIKITAKGEYHVNETYPLPLHRERGPGRGLQGLGRQRLHRR